MDRISRRRFMSYSLAVSGLYLLKPNELVTGQTECPPTRPDVLGPFYRAGAPERDIIGVENTLVTYGYVMSMACEPIPGALIEVWQATPDAAGAEYVGFTSPDYEYYATLFSNKEGFYYFYTDMPGLYAARPIRHIHYRVTAKGYYPLVTQLYFTDAGKETEAYFDLVLFAKP